MKRKKGAETAWIFCVAIGILLSSCAAVGNPSSRSPASMQTTHSPTIHGTSTPSLNSPTSEGGSASASPTAGTGDSNTTTPSIDVILGLDLSLEGEFQQYHSLAEYQDLLQTLSHQPGAIGLEQIGQSIEGRPIMALGIGDHQADTEVLVMGLVHANEWQGGEMSLYLAAWLLANLREAGGEAGDLLRDTAVWIVPVVNPDGYLESGDGDLSLASDWRKNRRLLEDPPFDPERDGVDLNRNFGYRWVSGEEDPAYAPGEWCYSGEAPFSEPETQAIRDLAMRHRFKLSFSLHSYGDVLYFPWGYTDELCPDFDVFFPLAEEIARRSGLEVYLESLDGGTAGNSDDYLYGQLGIYALTEEMGSSAFTEPEDLLSLLEEKLPGLLYAIQQAPLLPVPQILADSISLTR